MVPEQLERVPRPGSNDYADAKRSSGAIQRNNLTLVLSLTAIVLSCASAGVNLFVFYSGGQQKMVNEADQILVLAEANRILREASSNPKSHPELNAALGLLYKSLVYRPPFDAKLSVYERAAFGLVVESYAKPLAEVQLRQVEAIDKSLNHGMIVGSQNDWRRMRCSADPYGPGCNPEHPSEDAHTEK